MSPKSRHTITVAAIAVGITAIGAIAVIQGWLPAWSVKQEPAQTPVRITGTAPPESLSPGESLVAAPEAKVVPSPPAEAPPPAAPAAAPAPPTPSPRAEPAPRKKAAPQPPSYATSPPRVADSRRGPCSNCGVVVSTLYREQDVRSGAWEVRVAFDDGTRLILRYPTHPGFRAGDRVLFTRGRLHRD